MQEQIRYCGNRRPIGHCWIVDRTSFFNLKHSVALLSLDEVINSNFLSQAISLVPDLPPGLTIKQRIAFLQLEAPDEP